MHLTRALIVLIFVLTPAARTIAQVGEVPLLSPPIAQEEDVLPTPPAGSDKAILSEPPVDEDVLSADEPVAELEWFSAPPSAHAPWSFQVDLIPTTMMLTDSGFGIFSRDSSPGGRVTLANEAPDGAGFRAQAWGVTEDFGFFNVDATTLYLDWYVQRCIHELELLYGYGLAGAYLDFAGSQYLGLGGSFFGDAFFPLVHYTKSDLGIVANGRLALLISAEDELIDDWGATIDELGWGIRWRRNFGETGNQHWNIDITREIQHWGAISGTFASEEVFQGTAIKFGITW
jgi:hypothetical protein